MSHRTDTPPPTAERDLDRVAAALRLRFDREVASASPPEPVPTPSPSDGSSAEDTPPRLPPVAAREVPLIRPGAAASARADPLAARALDAAVAAVSRYAREETARLAAFAKKLELGVRDETKTDASVSFVSSLEKWRASVDACARRATLAGDVLEHAIDVLDVSDADVSSPRVGRGENRKETETIPGNARANGVLRRSVLNADAFGLRASRKAFEPVVLALSAAYQSTRARSDPGEKGEASNGTWRPPDTFERKTAKYWVEPRHALRLKLEIAKHLPVLVFDPKKRDAARATDTVARRRSVCFSPKPRDGGFVTSVYLDSADASVYDSRLTREQGATLVRVRWYGDEDDASFFGEKPSSLDEEEREEDILERVFVERKTHHESWSRDGSTKERFATRRRDVRAFLTGDKLSSDVEDASSFVVRDGDGKNDDAALETRRRLANEIARFELREKRVAPSVRTEYRRVAFQRSDDNAVRVSLDLDLTFADARGTRGDERAKLAAVETKRKPHAFPFAILEVKTRDETPPEWVERVLRSVPCVEVRKFSKFLHATMLTRGRECPSMRAPHWWCEESDAGVDAFAVRSRYARGAILCAAPSSRFPEVVVNVPDAILPARAASDNNANDAHIARRTADLESGLLDAARDDTSDKSGGSSSSVSGVTRDERAAMDRFLLGGGSGGGGGASAKATRVCSPFSRFSFFRDATKRREAEGRLTNGSSRETYVPVKVEPKTFFANERTLLQWLSMSVLLLFAALALLSGAAIGTAPIQPFEETTFPRDDRAGEMKRGSGVVSRVASAPSVAEKQKHAAFFGGAALAAVSVAFMAYALWTYLWRARRIARREPSARYDDVAGPTTLVVVLVIVSSIAAVVAVRDAAR